jgi:putative SOS response-associated peptidase YedK
MTQQTDPRDIARIFDADLREDPEAEPFVARYNVAPTDPINVVVHREDGRFVERHRWGLVPSWAPSLADGARMINARSESLAESPAFRVALRQRRCIVPTEGFYEWRREGTRRLPYYLHAPDDGLLAMAGLWSVWKDPRTGSWIPSASVVTTRANHDVALIHDRMPVLLEPQSWHAWLDPDERNIEWLQSLLAPAPDRALVLRPVSTRVNSVRNDGRDLIEQVEEPAQATLFG